MFLGKLFIVAGNGLLMYLALTQWQQAKDEVSSPYFPIAVACIVGYIVGAVFMSIFSFSSDTILQCFFLDEELGERNKRPRGNRPPEMEGFVEKATGGGGCCGCCC